MLSSDNQIEVMIMPTTALTAAGTAFGYCDTKGYNFVDIDVIMTTTATDDVPSVLKIGETDHTTNHTVTSDMTDIAAFLGGTAFTIPITAQTVVRNGYVNKFRVDCRKRKRYLGVSITLGTETNGQGQICVIANKSGAEEGVDATSANMIGLVAG